MAETRRYVSPKREAQAAATREAILEAFVEQLSEPGRQTLSPSEAARRLGVSVRTVHTHFPNLESQIVGLGDWFDRKFYPEGVVAAPDGPNDLARYFREIHARALQTPVSRILATASSAGIGREVRQRRRAERLDAIRRAVKQIGAPPRATEDATAILLTLSGADAAWPMHDLYGLPIDRIPDVIANTVELVVEQLRSQAKKPDYPQAATNEQETNMTSPGITSIHHVSLTVTDIEQSVPWYSEVLGLTKLMEEVHPDGHGYAVVLGTPDWSMCVGLHTHPTNTSERFAESRTGLDHLSFLVSNRAELDIWETRLTELGIEHSQVNDQDGYSVLVFRDPDNIQLELTSMG